jgi:hypothetical protein
MPAIGDSLTIAIVLILIFGAVSFYLYSRLSQNEKRVSLLENLLLNLKMSTEASLSGPDMIEPTSSPAPLDTEDVEQVSEVDYAEMLKDMPAPAEPMPPAPPMPPAHHMPSGEIHVDGMTIEISKEEDVGEEVLRTLGTNEVPAAPVRKMDANYESLSLKELQSLAKERSLTGVPARKRDLIDALKKQGQAAPFPPHPLEAKDDDLEGVTEMKGATIELN